MKPTTIQELYDLSPWGARVRYNDGTPKPPARHKKKVEKWERSNGEGIFTKSDAPYNHEGATGGISLMLIQSDVLIYNQGFSLNTQLNFEFEPPAPGTIITYSEWRETNELKHIYKDWAAFQHWCLRKGYKPFNHGYKVWIVGANGELQNLTEAPVEDYPDDLTNEFEAQYS